MKINLLLVFAEKSVKRLEVFRSQKPRHKTRALHSICSTIPALFLTRCCISHMFYISTYVSSKLFAINASLWLFLHVNFLKTLILTNFDPKLRVVCLFALEAMRFLEHIMCAFLNQPTNLGDLFSPWFCPSMCNLFFQNFNFFSNNYKQI